MGKIAMSNSTKKSDDLVKPAVIRESLTKPSPKKVKSPVLFSPTPKNPLSSKKSGVCRRLFLFCLGIFVILFLFSTSACLLDYRVANLGNHGSKLRDFPKEVGKYMVDVLYETPKGLHMLFNVAASQVQSSWTAKTGDISPRMKAWEEMKEGKTLKSMEEAESLVDNETGPQKDLHQNDVTIRQVVKDKNINDLEKISSFQQSSYKEVKDDDALVEEELQGVAGFFLNMLTDIASIFTGFEVNSETADGITSENDMIETNEIPRATLWKNTVMTEPEMLDDDQTFETAEVWMEEIDLPEVGRSNKAVENLDVEVEKILNDNFFMEEMDNPVEESTSDKEEFMSFLDDRKLHSHEQK